MIENEIIVTNNNINLSGSLCLPDKRGKFPLVLMVAGSGDIDRNENKRGFKSNIFSSIAHHLADNGIASFRYDKRGVGKSSGDFYQAGHFDLVDDAELCLDHILTLPECDQTSVFLLGHSEGSIIVPQISNRNTDVAGLILLAPFVDKIESLMMTQSRDLKKTANSLKGIKHLATKLLFSIYDPVRAQHRVLNKIKNNNKDVIYSSFQKLPAKWIRELMQVDPEDVFRNNSTSMLIIGGSKDVQCNPEDVYKIKEIAKGDIDAHVIEDLSHILRIEKGIPSIFTYKEQLKLPMDKQVLDLIIGWVKDK